MKDYVTDMHELFLDDDGTVCVTDRGTDNGPSTVAIPLSDLIGFLNHMGYAVVKKEDAPLKSSINVMPFLRRED